MSRGRSELEGAVEGVDEAFADDRLDAETTSCGGHEHVALEAGASWVEIEMVDERDQPVAGVRYRLESDPRRAMEGRLGADGRVRIDGIGPGTYRLSFPELDVTAWSRIGGAAVRPPPLSARIVATHDVGDCDCMLSIAARHGFGWQALWGHPANNELRRRRDSPTVLAPGDQVRVPEPRVVDVDVATERRHRFRREGTLATIRLRLRRHGLPRVNQPYQLDYAGQIFRGRTTMEGAIEARVPVDAGPAILTVGEGDARSVYRIVPRALDPVAEPRGVQSRLANLGYHHGPRSAALDAATTSALRAFQHRHHLAVDGQATPDTTAALERAYRGLAR